jgi:hypothetical protein
MHSLEDILQQADEDYYTNKIDGHHLISYASHGYKISKDVKTQEIVILSTTRGGDFYDEANELEYKEFFNSGWKIGLYVLYLSNCRLKLSSLDVRINKALVENQSVKVVRRLKFTREKTIKNFNQVKFKLKQNEKTK